MRVGPGVKAVARGGRWWGWAGAAGVLAGVAGYACVYERHHVEVVSREVYLARLARGLNGLRVVQLSDIHFKHYAEASYLRRVVREVNRLAPDLVLLTGDYVSELTFGNSAASAKMAEPCAEILAGLTCRNRWASLGNHDALVGPGPIAEALERHGFPVLQDRCVAWERDGARLWIAGTKSAVVKLPDLNAAVPEQVRTSGDAVILMAHEPDFADEVRAHDGVDLMLSGHTHGGQVRFPLIGATKLPRMGRRYVQGLFEFPEGMQLYVNRGVGAMKLPVRFLCRPEITVFTLRSGSCMDTDGDERAGCRRG